MPAGRFEVGRKDDVTLNMSKGNYFPLRVAAPGFDGSAAHLGAPVEGVTADPAKIPEEDKPAKSMLRSIPAHLPDLALGQRWAKGYYAQALNQTGKGGKRAQRRTLQGLLASEAHVGRRVVAVDFEDAAANCRDMTRQLQGIELKRGELQGRLAANKAWEPLNFKDTRRQLNSILAEEERYQCVRARRLRRILRQRVAEQRPGMIVATQGQPRLADGAISVLWENGTTLRYYRTLNGGTRYPIAHQPRSAPEPPAIGEKRPETGAWTLVLGLNATMKPGEADRAAEARRHREILKRCLKNMTQTLMTKCFRKFQAYRRPKSYCLLTLKPIDNEDHFYEEGIQHLIQARPRDKFREEWMDELCDNAVDPDWIENKQREEEERIQKGREHVMTGLTAKRLSIKERKVKMPKPRQQPEHEGWAVDALQTGALNEAPRGGQGSTLITDVLKSSNPVPADTADD